MSFVVEGDMRILDDVEEASGELGDATTKEADLSQKVVHTDISEENGRW